MARALPISAEIPYVLKADRKLPPKEQTTWFVRTLPYEKYVQHQNDAVEMQRTEGPDGKVRAVTRVLTGSQERDALLEGTVRVENFLDAEGNAVPYPKADAQRMEFWSRVLPEYRAEIARFILGEQEVTPEEKGE